MSDALAEARWALQSARSLLARSEPDDTTGASMKLKDAEDYGRLTNAALVQANVAQAEALERIAIALESR